jgi:hypothetical protein
MNKLSIFALAMVLASPVLLASPMAFADDDPSAEEAAKIKAAVAEWGCEGGEYEKETEGTGVFEAEDVKCKSGNYDFRLDKNFKVFAITMD